MNKAFLIFLIIVVLIGMANVYLIFSNMQINRSLAEIKNKKNQEYEELLKREQELMKKELDLKYKENITSYEATFKDLNIEKQKLKELETAQLKNKQETRQKKR